MQKIPNISYEPKKELHWHTLLLGIFVAAAFFIPYIVYGEGYFLFYGDFNVQQVPFYQRAHELVRSGEIGWDWGTDLGANFIGSYSFYLLGSPFFWITLLFPNVAVPYLMGPLLILKFGFAAFTAYFYIRRFVRNPESAMLGGLLYAFCGFSVYNIFFNHFHEAIIMFPLLLLSIEMNIADKRRGPVAFAVCACAVTNYFFFYGMVIFAIIYWIVRSVSGCWKQKIRSFLCFVFEAVIGLMMSMVILYPSILAVLQNSRLDSINLGYDSWLYGRVQIYANILEIFFFPPDIPARPVFFPNADIKWSSMGAWLPLFSMVGVFAFLKTKRRHWIKRLLCVCLFMALVPILNSAFYMFNSAYYARWFYMPILLMCLATVMAIEDDRVDWKPAFKWVSVITAAVTLIVGLWPDGKDENGKITRFGIYTYEEDSLTYIVRFWVTCAIAILSLAVLGILLKKFRKYHKQFIKSATATVCIISVVYAAVFIGFGSSHSYDIHNEVIPNLIEGELKLDGDSDTFRIDCYECMDNTAMFLGYSGINAFHSIVPGSVTEFYEFIGEERSVASRPETDNYSIRSLLSVRYLLSRVDGESFIDENGNSLMPGYKFVKQEDGFNVYENEYYIPFGFTYDYYVSYDECNAYEGSLKSNMLVKALLLDDEQIEKYGHLLKNVEDEPYNLSKDSYYSDCEERKRNAAEKFERVKNGFNSTITLQRDNLVFFSVPYEEGWKAYVNGKPAEIEKVNSGFMAVLAKSGVNEIEFRYTTPGLFVGVIITVFSAFIFAAYLLIIKAYRKRHPAVYGGEWPEGEELAEYFAENPEVEYVPKVKEESEIELSSFSEEPERDETYIDIDAVQKFIGDTENIEDIIETENAEDDGNED